MFLTAKRRKLEDTIERLYGAIVAQSRQPVFYRELGVPDTLEGRFDLLVLHLHLLYRRLGSEDGGMKQIGQGVFDFFVGDMDASLRELGVGDLAVPKRMRVMGEAFYGRASVYDAALAGEGDDALADALLRNVYSNEPSKAGESQRLARYVRRAVATFAAAPAEQLAAGVLEFPQPEATR